MFRHGVYYLFTPWFRPLTPCSPPPPQLDHDEAQERIIEPEDGDGEGWVDTHHFSAGSAGPGGSSGGGGEGTARSMEAPADPPPPSPPAPQQPPQTAEQEEEEEGEACDMEEFEEAGLDDQVSEDAGGQWRVSVTPPGAVPCASDVCQ